MDVTSLPSSTSTPSNSLEDLKQLFTWVDYLVFSLLLAVSAGIGVFYGFFKRNKGSEDFLMAGRNMSTFPMAMSLIASFMSAITLLGTPAETYQYGTMYWLIGCSYFLVIPAAAYLYLPIFFKLECTSAYEYLERRFSRSLRSFGSAIFTVQMVLYMAVVVYAPALALSQVTGVDLYVSICLIFGVCIFYTVLVRERGEPPQDGENPLIYCAMRLVAPLAFGGMKAVIWTDTVQVVIMYTAMLGVVLQGVVDEGGFANVWSTAYNSTRIEFFEFSADPTVRHSVWSLVIGGYFTWIAIYGVNQAQVQRYLTVRNQQQAVNALWINLVGLFLLLTICAFAGLVIYTKYQGCDPLKQGLVTTADQLFPLFVMDVLGHLPGVPGVFVAGIFSGALSTVSSGLNSLAAITLEDFVLIYASPNMNDKRKTLVSKGLSLGYGIVSFGFVFVAQQLGDVLQASLPVGVAALSIFGMIGGPLLGMFTLGMFFPWANSKGALAGTLMGLAFTFWIGLGANISRSQGLMTVPKKPLSTEHCDVLFTSAASAVPTLAGMVSENGGGDDDGDVLGLYHLSYMWYSAVACFTVIIVGLLVSFLTGAQDPKTLNPNLICPFFDRVAPFLPERIRRKLRFHVGECYDASTEGTAELKMNPSRATMISETGETNLAFQPSYPELKEKVIETKGFYLPRQDDAD
ncbi:unnamed protein product [Darwinula stevensoni]|uniref:Sodium-coupled monocarboxylate transporter 1 n=1 Tax=Darwinula stevensoni TaxID=69355 RepID=A0A7R9A0H0_9CRUS|nr:unnamed protein product [Darwinula stevensoni]CAG0884607.1 unnamed protein product [Darwinula stevensoni]